MVSCSPRYCSKHILFYETKYLDFSSVRINKWPGNSIFLAGKIITLVISVGTASRDSTGLGIVDKIQRLVRTILPMALVAVMFQLNEFLIYTSFGWVSIERFYVCTQVL